MKKNTWNKVRHILLILMLTLLMSGCSGLNQYTDELLEYAETIVEYSYVFEELLETAPTYSTIEDLPEYDGSTFVVINDNVPSFAEDEITEYAYEEYSELDLLGRCGPAEACVGIEIMPTEERESIGQVKPTGWQTVKYDVVDGKYLYNRCHLIGYQLTGENANEKNLITGTRYLNVDEMLMFENMIADYVETTENHVMYRVIPIFEGNNLVATGVEMEAYSVEDDGEGISFHVFCYNVQPGVEIDYATGDSWLSDAEPFETDTNEKYILNTNSKKYHLPSCSNVSDITKKNKEVYSGTKADLEKAGFTPCKICEP